MFKIGDFSKLTRLTIRALHHYEKMGILLPKTIDSNTNYRYYSASQLASANKIKMLQKIGFSLKDIKTVLESNDANILEYYYRLRDTEIVKELNELKKKRNFIGALKEKIKDDIVLDKYNVELKRIPERKVMSIRRIVPSYDSERSLWYDLHKEFINQKVKMNNPYLCMTVYHDNEYKDNSIDIEVQSSIVGDYMDTSETKFYKAPGFEFASVVFGGSFKQMPEVTQAIALWIETNGYIISGPMINIPHISPAQDNNPDNWVTEAGFIVRKYHD